MWTQFRAVARRLGLSREQVEAVERAGEPTVVAHPLDPNVQFRVRPDPDWTERLSDAWNGVLVNSRRESAGVVPLPDGRLLVGAPESLDQGIAVDLVPGEYEVVLTIAYEGSEDEGDYSEAVSHAFALLRGGEGVASIEPMTTEEEVEVGVEVAHVAFTGTGVLERLAAEHGGDLWKLEHFLIQTKHEAMAPGRGIWAHVEASGGDGALTYFRAGHGRDDYPVYRMVDLQGRTVGVMLDFFVDNRPY